MSQPLSLSLTYFSAPYTANLMYDSTEKDFFDSFFLSLFVDFSTESKMTWRISCGSSDMLKKSVRMALCSGLPNMSIMTSARSGGSVV